MSIATHPRAQGKAPEPAIPEGGPLSTWRIFFVALSAAAIMFVVGAGLDRVILHEYESGFTAIELSNSLGGIIAGGLVFRLLQYERERRKRLRQKIAVIADMNHHVRNALQVISFQTYSTADKEQFEAIRDSMERIQWALKEILPRL